MTFKISETRMLGTPCCQSIRDFNRNCHSGSGARRRVVGLEGNRELACVRKSVACGGLRFSAENAEEFGVPYGSRTRVAAVKGRCPRPLDERDALSASLT